MGAVASKPKVSAFAMYRALVGVGIVCGLLIVTVYETTKPIIAANQAAALERAIFEVIPLASSSRTFAERDEGFVLVDKGVGGERLVYAGYDDKGELVGLAIPGAGMGYADTIRILYGYSFDKDVVTGMVVLESKETPGLGDKIEKDPVFLENFEALDVSLDDSGEALKNAIEVTKSGEKTDPWQIDGITGATISSETIGDILRKGTEYWVPKAEKWRDHFLEGGDK